MKPAIGIPALAIVLGLAYNALSPLGVRPAAAGSPYANQTVAAEVEPRSADPSLRNETISAEVVPSGATPAAALAQELVAWPQAREIVNVHGGLLVDARSADAFAAGHIPGAVSLPYTRLGEAMGAFASAHSPDTPLVVYCSDTACPVSEAEARELRERYGYRDVRELAGGYAAWRLAQQGAGP